MEEVTKEQIEERYDLSLLNEWDNQSSLNNVDKSREGYQYSPEESSSVQSRK